ncbi:MAG: efflux RND transporter periplasmic adaptor subunit [Ardenticatenaceae bacterium]|nr:efflux RND transporter periplasmic adaptor subunit [Ardenticatenaceae bacterium]HBY96028.1 hypothetical protein [Chloroflexota bacterium]
MKRIVIILGIIAVLAGGWWVYTNVVAPQGTANAPSAATPEADLENVIWASGKLVPVSWASLSPAAGGTIRAIHIAEGDQVDAGTLLVELDNGILQSQVDVAAAALAEAEAARDKVLAGATPAQVDAAQAEVATAQANVVLAQADVLQANEAVAAAQAHLQKVREGPDEKLIIAAQADLANAQAALEQAQAAYDQVKWRDDVAALPQSLQLQQATNAYLAAKARYEEAQKGASAADLAATQAEVRQAQARVSAAEAGVQAAQAQAARAAAGLKALTDGATAEDKAMAEARVQSAQAALLAAKAPLQQTQVIAPFAGQVGTVFVRPGELSTPGQPVLVLGDTRQMRVETTDLRETDVTRLQVGMPVEVTFDALPGRTFQGSITRIAPMSTTEKGSTNYTVTVDAADLDPALRWGMTAFVNIRVK